MLRETRIEVSPSCQGGINKSNLIGAEGDIFIVLGYREMTSGVLFEVVADDYVFGLEIRDKDVVLLRNDTVIIVPLARFENRGEHFLLNFGWSPGSLRLHISDAEGPREYKAPTRETFPPQSLKRWARQQALIPTTVYESEQHLLEAVLDQFHKLQHSLKDTNGTNGFWDIQYSGQKIIKRTPKRETDVHPTIRLLLYDLEIIKNFQIIPEFPIGNGRLDFLITAPLKSGKVGKVCIEFKSAHSNDLASGIMIQLPEYMERTNTDFGIYAVLDYRTPYSFKPKTFKLKDFPGPINDLETALNISASGTGRKYLRFVILTVGPTSRPSKKVN